MHIPCSDVVVMSLQSLRVIVMQSSLTARRSALVSSPVMPAMNTHLRCLTAAGVLFGGLMGACSGEILAPLNQSDPVTLSRGSGGSGGAPGAQEGGKLSSPGGGGRVASGGRAPASGGKAGTGGRTSGAGSSQGKGGALAGGGSAPGSGGRATVSKVNFWAGPYDGNCGPEAYDTEAFLGQANMSGDTCAKCHIPNKLSSGAKRGWDFAGSIRVRGDSSSSTDGIEHVEVGVRSPANDRLYRTCSINTGEFFLELLDCKGCIDWSQAEVRIRTGAGEKVAPAACGLRSITYQGTQIGGLCNTCHSPNGRPTPLGYLTAP